MKDEELDTNETELEESGSKETYDPYQLYDSDEEGDIIYPLAKPFSKIEKTPGKAQNKTVTVEKLTVRAPNGSDLRATQDLGQQEAAYIQIQRCARLKPQSFDKLCAKDISELSNIMNFLAEA